MLIRPIATLFAALLLLTGAVMTPAAAQAQTDWTKTVTVTSKGGFILGNPAAKTKLVEYMSYSCPHCADFAKEANTELKARIKTGQFSVEYRNFIRDPFDLSAALVARCGGQTHFLANHEAIFSSYDAWMEKAQTYSKDPPKIEDRAAQLADIADKVGFIALAGKNGLAPDVTRKCIADPNAMATVLALTAGAWDADPNFEGTPTFLLNGKVVRGIHSWQGLKPQLPALPAPAK